MTTWPSATDGPTGPQRHDGIPILFLIGSKSAGTVTRRYWIVPVPLVQQLQFQVSLPISTLAETYPGSMVIEGQHHRQCHRGQCGGGNESDPRSEPLLQHPEVRRPPAAPARLPPCGRDRTWLRVVPRVYGPRSVPFPIRQ